MPTDVLHDLPPDVLVEPRMPARPVVANTDPTTTVPPTTPSPTSAPP